MARVVAVTGGLRLPLMDGTRERVTPPLAMSQAQRLGGPMGQREIRPHQQATVVAHQLAPPAGRLVIPTDPAFPRFQGPGRATEQQPRPPLAGGVGDRVLAALAHGLPVAEIMMLIEQLIKARARGSFAQPHRKLIQHGLLLRRRQAEGLLPARKDNKSRPPCSAPST
jgi:hypothetical protein